MKKVLLYSGGMDSWLIDKLWHPDVLVHVCVGTSNEKCELAHIRRTRPDVVCHEIRLAEFEDKNRNFLLPARNLFLVSIGAYYGDIICLGATGSSTHFDKSEKFCRDAGSLLTYLWSEHTDRKISVVTPFHGRSKGQLLAQYIEEGGSPVKCWSESFSCYSPNKDGSACWKCSSCLKKINAFKENGYDFLH